MEDLDLGNRHRRLLEAALVLTSEHSPAVVLQRIVELAAELTEARYAALGVIAAGGGSLSAFLTTGLSAEERAAIGPLPEGHGILGVIIQDPRPLIARGPGRRGHRERPPVRSQPPAGTAAGGEQGDLIRHPRQRQRRGDAE